MAEGTLFSFASTLISTIASPPCEAFSLSGASDELQKALKGIETIQAVLIDAEKRSQHSAAESKWIRRVSDVLFAADDLFDEVATIHLLYQQNMKKGLSEGKGNSSTGCSFSESIHDRLNAVRMNLDQICKDLERFEFVRQYEEPVTDIRKGTGSLWSTDLDLVVGREDEMNLILEFLSDETTDGVPTMAIIGIEGMGKTTLAQLVYNSEEVCKSYKSRLWVDNQFDSLEYQIHSFKYRGLKKKSLLVIDDADELESLLCSMQRYPRYIRGSKIIFTARSSWVPVDIKVDKTLNLSGLSFGPSWDLFKGLAFTREQENDPSWNSLGRKILKKCGNIPMAIKSVASLLYTKSSKEEWKTILDLLPEDSGGSIMPLLKLSYDSLPSNLKLCFSFCSMFPRYFKIQKDDLIRLWAAQGYVIPTNYETYEEVGEASFNKLERRFFLSDKKTGHFIMHGLIHDLAVNVAKGEIALTGNLYDITDQQEIGEASFNKFERSFFLSNKKTVHSRKHALAVEVAKRKIALTGGLHDITDQQVRHCTVGYVTNNSQVTSVRLRSFIFMRGRQLTAPVVEQLLTSFKFLRALDLRNQNIREVPSSIGGLLHLRYLNLSKNHFQNLPESITELLNLLILDISSCQQLKRLPLSFARLINLRHLNNKDCMFLQYMPPRFGELTSLEHLSCFKVGNVTADVKSSRLDALRGMQLRGDLKIDFDCSVDSWDEDECWELPTTVQTLEIYSYPGMRIPHWDQRRVELPSLLPRLVKVNLSLSSTIKYLPPFRHLPYLKTLRFSSLRQLTYVEDDQDQHASRQCDQAAAGYFMLFFPFLEELELIDLPNLRGWSREVEAVTTSKVLAAEEHSSCRDPSDQMPFFPILSTLKIERCPMLMAVPPYPSLRTLELRQIGEKLIHHLLSTCSYSLETAVIDDCFPLSRFSGQTLTSLRRLELKSCHEVKDLHLPQHNVLEELIIYSCPRLKLWGKGGVNWVSLINLRLLLLDETPFAEWLPVCLEQSTALGILKIDSRFSLESSVQGTKAQVDGRGDFFELLLDELEYPLFEEEGE